MFVCKINNFFLAAAAGELLGQLGNHSDESSILVSETLVVVLQVLQLLKK